MSSLFSSGVLPGCSSLVGDDLDDRGGSLRTQCAVVSAGGCRLELHIHIHQGVGGSVSVQQVQQQQQSRLLDSSRDSAKGPSALEKLPVVQLLRIFGVRDPMRYADFPRDRVMAVVTAGRARRRKNLGGWIATALSRNWDLAAYETEAVEVLQ